MPRSGYVFDNHKKLVEQFHAILDEAAVEYDEDVDVVDDFNFYAKSWANARESLRPVRRNND